MSGHCPACGVPWLYAGPDHIADHISDEGGCTGRVFGVLGAVSCGWLAFAAAVVGAWPIAGVLAGCAVAIGWRMTR